MSLTRNIVGCWSPSLGASGYLLRDVSGRNNHGTLTNMDPGTDWVASERGLVLDFDGTDDYVISQSRAFELVSPFAVSVWYRPTTRKAYAGILSTFNSFDESATSGWILYDGALGFSGTIGIILGGARRFTAVNVSVLNEWQHLVALFIQGGGQLFINGVERALSGAALGAASYVGTTQLKIGSYTTGNGRNNAQIGEAAIYDRALTAPEIAELYRRGNGWLGRELTGMNQRRTYGKKLGNRRRRLLCGGMT